MMPFSLIPAIDIIDGGLVRLVQGDYNRVTSYDISVIDIAHQYVSMGLKYIHVVDLNGAKDGDLINLSVIKEIASLPDVDIQVGGGIRSRRHVELLLEAGASAVIIGSLFVQDTDLALQIVDEFPGHVIAGLDIINGCLATHGWTQTTETSLDEMIHQLSNVKLHSIVTTDISKDGTFDGLNMALYERMSTLSSHSIIASGGVSQIDDVIELRAMNLPKLSGCIVGKAIIEGRISASDIARFL